MSYTRREILDRIAVDDDIFTIEYISNNKMKLIPSPTSIIEEGTNINKALLQPIEDNMALIVNNNFIISNKQLTFVQDPNHQSLYVALISDSNITANPLIYVHFRDNCIKEALLCNIKIEGVNDGIKFTATKNPALILYCDIKVVNNV